MKVDTKAFGLVEVDEKQKITFVQGLFGFDELHDYILMDAEHQPFYWLQSTEEKEIAFILINPFLFRPDYEVNISNEELNEIGIHTPEQSLIFAIVTIPQDGGSMTANLQGPIVINNENKTAKQAVLTDERWRTRHDIVAELKGARN